MQKPTRKVLILTTHFAPAYKAGGIVRSLENLILNFQDEFDFSVVTGNKNLDKRELLSTVIHDEWVSFTGNIIILYLFPRNQNAGNLWGIFQKIQPEVIYINGLFSIPFTLIAFVVAKKKCPNSIIILAPWGMLLKGNLSVKPRKKKIYLSLFKILGIHHRFRWQATDEQEKESIIKFFGTKVEIILASALPDLSSHSLQFIRKIREPLKLITISLITPNKGHLKLIRALKELKNEIEVEYHIYGSIKDNLFWGLCLKEIKTLKSSINVI